MAITHDARLWMRGELSSLITLALFVVIWAAVLLSLRR